MKNTPLYELNEAYKRVLIWFFSFPQAEIGLNDLAKRTNISKTTAHRIVSRLISERFLRRKIFGKSWILFSNQDHFQNLSRKIVHNLAMIGESSVLEEIHKKIPAPLSIILFGSYRKGDDTEKSDIDIAVEVNGAENMRVVELGILKRFGYRRNVVVNMHIFSRKSVDPNVFANIANGIVLDGFLEVQP